MYVHSATPFYSFFPAKMQHDKYLIRIEANMFPCVIKEIERNCCEYLRFGWVLKDLFQSFRYIFAFRFFIDGDGAQTVHITIRMWFWVDVVSVQIRLIENCIRCNCKLACQMFPFSIMVLFLKP